MLLAVAILLPLLFGILLLLVLLSIELSFLCFFPSFFSSSSDGWSSTINSDFGTQLGDFIFPPLGLLEPFEVLDTSEAGDFGRLLISQGNSGVSISSIVSVSFCSNLLLFLSCNSCSLNFSCFSCSCLIFFAFFCNNCNRLELFACKLVCMMVSPIETLPS